MLLWTHTGAVWAGPLCRDGCIMFNSVCWLSGVFWKVLHIIQLPSSSACFSSWLHSRQELRIKVIFYSYFKLNLFRFHVWSADQHIPEISLLIIFTLIVSAPLSLPPPASAADFCTSCFIKPAFCVVLPLFHILFLEEGESQSVILVSAYSWDERPNCQECIIAGFITIL